MGKAVYIWTVTGLLILVGQAVKTGLDIYDICDCIDGYAEFIYSALSKGEVAWTALYVAGDYGLYTFL